MTRLCNIPVTSSCENHKMYDIVCIFARGFFTFSSEVVASGC